MHARSRWTACPECDGREGDEVVSTRCDRCTFGVVELAPTPAPTAETDEGLAALP